MHKLNKKLFSLLCAACIANIACTICSNEPANASAESEFATGVQFYKSKNFRSAAKEFENSISHGNIKAPVFLYAAYAYQAYGERDEALRKYHQIADLFKDTQAATMAKQAIARLDQSNTWIDRKPQLLEQLKSQLQAQLKSSGISSGAGVDDKLKSKSKTAAKAATTTDNSLDDTMEDTTPQKVSKLSSSTPSVARVFYKSDHDEIMVDVRINGRTMPMVFDTGAPGICIDKEMAQSLGLAVPRGKADGATGGSSNTTTIDFWNINATVQVGPISKDNTRVKIYEKIHTRPLLGQGFFKDFDYTIDHSAKCIEFRKKGMSNSGGKGYSIPFTFKKEGRRIIVEVDINGKKGPVMLDTGNTASGIAFHSKEQMKKFGINELPEDAQLATTSGVSGSGSCYTFNLPRIKLGPIEKTNLNADLANEVDDDEDLPLLGQEMLSGWQFTIDMEKKVIHFLRR
ncbi:MAG: clan AA aspartic protease [Candidatus Melainabacteria bacterium]|nr:MAG: clan AA aspartic protease [Candidatus Melainabacteria bacterium]